MPTAKPPAPSHEIRHNGAQLLKGDKRSVSVIFNNLTGRNFKNPAPWQTLTHQDYLAQMAQEWNVVFSGSTIELAEVGHPAHLTHTFS